MLSTAPIANIAPVDSAARWADDLVHGESRGPGDLTNAMERVGRRTGVGYRTIWNLRYRRPKDLSASAFLKLWAAWEKLKEDQVKALSDDLARTRAEAGDLHSSIAAAQAILDSLDREGEAPLAPADHRQMAVTGDGR